MVDVWTLLQFLAEGDMLGFLQALFVLAFGSADIFFSLIAMAITGAIYIRTHSLILLGILWLLGGGFVIGAMPIVAGIGVFFMIIGVGCLLLQLFKPDVTTY